MSTDFNSSQLNNPQAVELNSKTSNDEADKQSLKQHEGKEKETLVLPSHNNGVVLTTASPSTSSFTATHSTTETDVVPQTVVDSIIKQGFPALANTTKPIPASVFSYRFASSSNNQTPYYLSSDIVLSGGIAQQTRRRIVHNEVERRRKDKINGWITKLSEVIPKCAYGKQSKNIVLENAVEYFTELNQKLKLQDEVLANKTKLELENQALKNQVQLLQNQNTELIELLEKNNIPLPQSLKDTAKNAFKQDPVRLQVSKPNDIISGMNNVTENTTVSLSSEVVPTGSTTTIGLTSIGASVNHGASSVQQTQPSFSMYTVSSIMNGPSTNISLVDSSNPGPVTLTIPVQADAVASADNSSTAIPIVMAPNVTSHTLSNLVTPHNINTQIAGITTAANGIGALGIGASNMHEPSANVIALNKPQQGIPQGTILGNIPQRIVVDNSTQGLTQVVLCPETLPQNVGPQGTTMVNVPKGPLVTSGSTLNTLPATYSLSNNTGVPIQSQGPIMTIGSSNMLQTSSNNRTRPVVGNTVPVFTSLSSNGGVALQSEVLTARGTPCSTTRPVVGNTVPIFTSLPSNGGVALQSEVLTARGTPCSTQAQLTNRPAVVIGKATTTSSNAMAVVPHSLLSEKGLVVNNKVPAAIGTPNSMQQLQANSTTVLVNKSVVNNSFTTPASLTSSHLLSNTGLVVQTQGPILSLGTPTATQTLPTKRAVVNSVGGTVLDQRNTPGSVPFINSAVAAIPGLPTNTNGMITGTPITVMLSQPPSAANIQAIPPPITTQTNTLTASTNPVTIATTGVINMNIPSAPVGPITTPQSSLVTLKLPKATIHPTSSTSKASNRYNTATTPTVNLTPSPGTAFVIVRSAPSQQPMNYPILPAQSLSQLTNYNPSTSVVTAKSTPTAIVQPTIQQTSGPFQIPFTVVPVSTSTPPVNAVAKARSSNSSKRSHTTSAGQSRTIATSSPQPPAKVAKNGKKRQPSRTSSGSKSKASKQKKSDQSKVINSASPSVSTTQGNGPRETRRNTDLCQQDMLTSQTFNISSLIPNIQSPNKNSPLQTSSTSTNPDNKKTGGATARSKPQHSSLRLSHSIDSLTGRRQEQTTAVPQLPQQNMISFSAESLLGSAADDLVSSLQPITCSTASNNTYTPQNTLTMTSFQENPADGNINQTFSNFSAEALISETDFMGIANDTQSSRSNFTQGNQSVKSTPARTQMFSDFSAESLINSSDLGSGLSYAIDNLISRSDNNDNNIAMTTVNPNLLHSSTSNILQDNIVPSLFTHSSSVSKNFSLSANSEFQNSNQTTDSTNMNFTKYNGFTSPQKQSKEIFSFKPNSTLPFSSSTTSPTYLKHSVDSITASQYNTAGSSTAGVFGSTITNTLTSPSFNSLFSLDQINSQQFQTTGNPFSLTGNLTRTSYQGPTMGSYA